MGLGVHLHNNTAVYRWVLPLLVAAATAAIVLACFWENSLFWVVIVAAAIVLVVAAVLWTGLLWALRSISLTRDNPYDYDFQGAAVRLYDFNVPEGGRVKVLEIDHDDAQAAVEASYVEVGQALAPAMVKMRWGLWVFRTLVASVMRAEDIDDLLDMLPEAYVKELEGLAEGVSSSTATRRCFLSRWTKRDWFIVQLIPDLETLVSHVNPCGSLLKRLLQDGNERRTKVPRPTVGCTALLTLRGFYRNMDWPSLGLMGQFTLLIRRQYLHTGAVTLEIGVPGLLGTVTGVVAWNPIDTPQNRGMLAMNVCCPHQHAKWITQGNKYLPASYVNRAVLAQLVDASPEASDIAALSDILDGYIPLAPYHLTFAKFVDGMFSGVMVHCLQDEADGHAHRRFPLANGEYLLTCNGNLTERREEDPQRTCFTVHAHDLMHTNARTAKVRELIATGERDGRNILSQSPICNHETCYMVALEQDVIELRVNNAYGASALPVDIAGALLLPNEQPDS